MTNEIELPTYPEFVEIVAEMWGRHVTWRHGQAAFNVLYDLRPDLAGQLRAGPLDPFYLDHRLNDFFAWVKDHWVAQ